MKQRKGADPMTGYIIRYTVWAPALFLLVYFEHFSPLVFLSEWQTLLTSYLTAKGIALFAMPIRMDGNTLFFEHGLRLFIVNDCNGLVPILLFWAAVIAFPTALKQKMAWLFAGYIVLTTLNMIRILAIAYGVSVDAGCFDWAHGFVGRYSIGVMTLTLFWIFTLKVKVVSYKTGFFGMLKRLK